MAGEDKPSKSGYGKRPLWQWVLIYVIVGGLLYGLIYYFAFSKGGYKAGGYTGSTTTQSSTYDQ